MQQVDSNVMKNVLFYPSYVTIAWYYKFAVFYLSGYKYLGDGGTDRREILHDSTYRSRTDLSPLLRTVHSVDPQIRKFWPKFWPLDREYHENGS